MKKLIVGNWKMHGGRADLAQIAAISRAAPDFGRVEAVACPPVVWLTEAARALESQALQLGAQDCSAHSGEGPYTGEVSAGMLAQAGASWVILGHSERRAGFGESDALVRAKAMAAWRAGLRPIVCVGESLEQRRSGLAEQVAAAQARSLDWSGEAPLAIAYEPLWAIGAGITPCPEDIARMNALLRKEIRGELRVLYGGSVKPGNAEALLQAGGVDGLLVGAASLDSDSFLAICKAAQASGPV